jgi:hypothetical protein
MTTIVTTASTNRDGGLLAVMSMIGSIASVIGLGIVILQEATKDHPIRHSLLGWRISLFGMALIAVSGSVLFTFFLARDAYLGTGQQQARRILKATACGVLGTALVGICLDGLFAAIYWTFWLSGPADFINGDVIGWLHRLFSY